MLQGFYFHLTAVPARPKAELAAAAGEGGSLTRHAPSAAGVNHNTSLHSLPAGNRSLRLLNSLDGCLCVLACVCVMGNRLEGWPLLRGAADS